LHKSLYVLSCVQNVNQTTTRCLSSKLGLVRDVDIDRLSTNLSTVPWKICASVCLVRLPIIEPEKNELEVAFEKLSHQIEFERSVLSDWEIEKYRQMDLISSIEAGEKSLDDLDFKVAHQDIEDGFDQVLNDFNDNSVETMPNNMDMMNPKRLPEESLVLLTKQKLGNDCLWMLPVETWAPGETLRETAEKALSLHGGVGDSASFISNAPSGFYKYKIPKKSRAAESWVGSKLFIYNAFLPRDSMAQAAASFSFDAQDGIEYAWVSRGEMRRYVKSKYASAIQSIML